MNTLNAIIPVFLSTADPFWHTPEGTRLILKTVQTAQKSIGVRKVFVFTDDPQIQEFTRNLDVDSLFLGGGRTPRDDGMLPPGTALSLHHLHNYLEYNRSDLIVLDFTNPLITRELIARAAFEFFRSRKPALVSVCASTDHPCQLSSYYRIKDLILVHCFDPNGSTNLVHPTLVAEDCFVTKPFYFDWEARGVHENTRQTMYARIPQEGSVRYLALDDESLRDTFLQKTPLWRHENSCTARVIFHPSLLRKSPFSRPSASLPMPLDGAGFSYDQGIVSALLCKAKGHSETSLFLSHKGKEGVRHLLKMHPFGLHPSTDDLSFEAELSDLSRPIALPGRYPDACGILLSLLEVVIDGHYDLEEPFPSSGELWRCSNGRTFASATGREILGRQDFPAVYELEGSISILRGDEEDRLDEVVSQGRAAPFLIPRHAAFHIRSRSEAMQYHARTAPPQDPPPLQSQQGYPPSQYKSAQLGIQ